MRNLEVVRVEHERADRHDAVLALAGDQGEHHALVGQSLLADRSQQAQFRRQRIHIPLRHLGQFDTEAKVAVRIRNRCGIGPGGFRFGRGRRTRHGIRCLRKNALRQRLQPQAYAVNRSLIDARTMMMAIHLHGQGILGHQEGIHMLGRQRHLALANSVEQRLQHVGDFGDVVESEGGGAALDGMRGAEDRVEVLAIGCGHIDSQQQLLHFGEQLIRFVEKNLVKLAHINRHAETPFLLCGLLRVVWLRLSQSAFSPLRSVAPDRRASPASHWPPRHGPWPSCRRRTPWSASISARFGNSSWRAAP